MTNVDFYLQLNQNETWSMSRLHFHDHFEILLPLTSPGNIFVNDQGVSGYIDLGRAGVADRYRDIAICYRSLGSNLRGSYGGHPPIDFDAEELFRKLDVTPDWDKIRYYILLDELF